MKTLLKFIYLAIAVLGFTCFASSPPAQAAGLYAWGSNSAGQLGDGTTTDRSTPVAVDTSGALSGKTVTAIAAGGYHTVALTSDGRLFAWGSNGAGQLGDGTTTNRSTPVAVDTSGALSGKTVTAISAGHDHTAAPTRRGSVLAWGGNSAGQLGDGSENAYVTPVAVDTSGALSGKTVIAISAGGSHTMALTSNGQLFAWGGSYYGQLGDGSFQENDPPAAVDMSGVPSGKTVTAT